MPRLANFQDPLPYLPNVSDLDWWSSFKDPNPMKNWTTDISSLPIDNVRTNKLAYITENVRCRREPEPVPILNGVPLQLANTRTTKVYEAKATPSWNNWFPSRQVPLPEVVYILSNTDEQWFGIDPVNQIYYECSAIGPTPFGWPAPWRADNICIWDLKRDWRLQKTGITGAKLPLWPMVPKIEKLLAGVELGHSLHFVAAGYEKDLVGIARATDGPFTNGHPLRAGERLRLRKDRIPTAKNPQEQSLITTMLTRGLIVTDRTRWDALTPGHSIRLPIDPRVSINLELSITDFEVILQS